MKTFYILMYLVSLFGGLYYMVQKDIYMEIFGFAYAIIFLLLSIEQRLIDNFKNK
jgi:hypothetical protein